MSDKSLCTKYLETGLEIAKSLTRCTAKWQTAELPERLTDLTDLETFLPAQSWQKPSSGKQGAPTPLGACGAQSGGPPCAQMQTPGG